MINRRNFLKNSGLVLGGSILLPRFALASSGIMPFGLILYTIRDEMEKDPVAALKKVSKTGYRVLEAASYDNGRFYGMDPSEIKKLTASLNMKLISMHVNLYDQDLGKLADAAAEAGLKYVVQASMPHRSMDDFKKGADDFNRFGEALAKRELKFGFHNHDQEFKMLDGTIPYDYLLQNTDPFLVCMELDIYWVTKAGADPVFYFNKYPGRFELWHMKDMEDTEARRETELGTGIIDYRELLALRNKAGLKYYFLEQDGNFMTSSMESIKTGIKYLRGLNTVFMYKPE